MTPSPTTPASAGLEADLHCLNCGYNLRGLDAAGLCPECGEPVADTLRGDWLIDAAPAWTSGLARGMGLLLVAFALWLGMFGAFTGGVDVGSVVWPAGTLLASLVAGVGYWLLTAREPGGRERPGMTLRQLARVLLMSHVALSLLAAAFVLAELSIDWAVIYGVGHLVGLAGFALLLARLRPIAFRVPSAGLGRQTRWMMWSYVGLTVFSYSLLGICMTTAPSVSGAVFFSVGVWLGLVVNVWLIVLLVRYYLAFRRIARSQQRTAAD